MAHYTIDCTNKPLGRVATEIATILQGKKSASYDPRLEGTDTVEVRNVDDLKLTGRKEEQKMYYSHTTQIGHLKERIYKDVVAKHGKKYILKHAVQRMLPKNKLQIRRMKRITFV
jgi:large subunit ribosomal protein L13